MTETPSRFALVTDYLLDGSGGGPETDAAVIVEGDRIRDVVRPAAAIRNCDDLRQLSFPGATLLPGLIDCHVHLTLDPRKRDLIEYHRTSSDEMLFARAVENARRALMSGVTTVRDLGARGEVLFELRDEIEAGRVPGPHLLLSGRPLTCPRGHCYFMGGEVADHQQIGAIIAEQADRGIVVTKFMATGGGLTPGTGLMRAQFDAGSIARIVSESRDRHLPVAAHAGWAPVIHECAKQGVHTIEHCTFITPTGLSIEERALKAVQSNGTHVVPTRYQFYLNRELKEMPSALKTEVQRTPAELFADSMAQLQTFREVGLRLAAGSDAGIIGMDFDGVIGELEVMVLAGYSPTEAVHAATGRAAEAVGVAADRGLLKPGYRADLLVVGGAVHQDVTCLRNPLWIAKSGREVAHSASASQQVVN